MVLLLIPSLIALGFIFYFAVSKKSPPAVRRLALIALILAAAALIICVIFIIAAPSREAEPGLVTLPIPVEPVTPVQKTNWQELAIFSLLFLFLLLFIFVLARKDRRSKDKKSASLKKIAPDGIDQTSRRRYAEPPDEDE
jgi:cytochrome bd-type quinol oxidase subunit 2